MIKDELTVEDMTKSGKWPQILNRIKNNSRAYLIPPPALTMEYDSTAQGFYRSEMPSTRKHAATGKMCEFIKHNLKWSPAKISLGSKEATIRWLIHPLREGVMGWRAEVTRRRVESLTAETERFWWAEQMQEAEQELARWEVMLESLIVAFEIQENQE